MSADQTELMGAVIGYALAAFGIGYGCGLLFTAVRRFFDQL